MAGSTINIDGYLYTYDPDTASFEPVYGEDGLHVTYTDVTSGNVNLDDIVPDNISGIIGLPELGVKEGLESIGKWQPGDSTQGGLLPSFGEWLGNMNMASGTDAIVARNAANWAETELTKYKSAGGAYKYQLEQMTQGKEQWDANKGQTFEDYMSSENAKRAEAQAFFDSHATAKGSSNFKSLSQKDANTYYDIMGWSKTGAFVNPDNLIVNNSSPLTQITADQKGAWEQFNGTGASYYGDAYLEQLQSMTPEQIEAYDNRMERGAELRSDGYTDQGMIDKILTSSEGWSDDQWSSILKGANKDVFGNEGGFSDFGAGGKFSIEDAWQNSIDSYAEDDAAFKEAYDPLIGAGGWLSQDETWLESVLAGETNPEYGNNPPPNPSPNPDAPDQGGDPIEGSVGDGTDNPDTGGDLGVIVGGGDVGGNGNNNDWDWSVIFPDIDFGDFDMDEIFGDLGDWMTGGEGGSVWSNISDLIGDISNSVNIDFGSIGDWLGGATDWLGDAWGGIEDMFGDAWGGMQDMFGGMGDLFGDAFGGLSDMFGGAWSGMQDMFSGAWEGIQSMFGQGMAGQQQGALSGALGTIGAALLNKQGIDRQLDLVDKYSQMGMDRADPFFQHRAQYGDKMNQLMSSPMDTTMLDPSYQWRFNQGLEALTRAGAAGGKLGSGNILTAAQDYGQNAASQEFQNIFNRYGALSGATTGNFGASADAALTGGGSMANLTGNLYGLGSGLLGNLTT